MKILEKKKAKKFAYVKKTSDLCSALRPKASFEEFGEMVEWSITPVLKTGVLRGTGGSNPSLSAQKPHKFNICDL